MRKIDVEIVFVVLVYRNIDDLQNLAYLQEYP